MIDFNAESTEFHAQIGFCIAEWANVDDHLFKIFRECLEAPLHQSAIVYFRLPGIDYRLNTTDELVLSRLPKPERASGGHPHESVKQWKAIKNEISDLVSTRRRIAHHPVNINATLMQVGLNPDLLEVRSWFEIAISDNEKYRQRPEPHDGLRLEELKDHWRAVNAIPTKLNALFFDWIQRRVVSLSQLPTPPLLAKNEGHET